MTEYVDNMQAVIDAARVGQAPVVLRTADHFEVVSTPGEVTLHTLDLEKFNATPFRKKGTVTVFDAESLNRLLIDNADAGHITVYVNPDANKPAIVAVLNGSGPDGPGWGDFRVSIGFRETPQWAKWKAIDGKLLPQVDFAEFVENNLGDIASPDGATMMEIVTYFNATRSGDFRSAVKLSNGTVQLTNIENIEAQVGAGNIAVPDTFEVALSPVFGVAPFRIPARFRYRIENRKLLLGFKLQRIEDVMATIMKDFEAEIVLPEGASKVYGTPP
jgi:uncharacterized protein YfdQ (DUF2303 family)